MSGLMKSLFAAAVAFTTLADGRALTSRSNIARRDGKLSTYMICGDCVANVYISGRYH